MIKTRIPTIPMILAALAMPAIPAVLAQTPPGNPALDRASERSQNELDRALAELTALRALGDGYATATIACNYYTDAAAVRRAGARTCGRPRHTARGCCTSTRSRTGCVCLWRTRR